MKYSDAQLENSQVINPNNNRIILRKFESAKCMLKKFSNATIELRN